VTRRPRRGGDHDDDTPVRPLPRRLAAMTSRQRVALALVGIVIGVGLMFAGLKLLSDDVNQPAPPTSQDG
jgi:hypothetical protein